MSDILLITHPDKIYNQNKTVSLVCPTEETKQEFQKILAESNTPINVYLIDETVEDFDYILTIHRMSEICVVDLDNLSPLLKKVESYLISFGNTFWLTKGNEKVYNMISTNRIYSIDQLNEKLGGSFEKIK